jgi:hypothetical protein
LQPPIALFNVYIESSSQTSSFNNTLSKVAPLVQVNINLEVLANQPSIPSSLQDSVDVAALAAEEAAGLFRNTTATTIISS